MLFDRVYFQCGSCDPPSSGVHWIVHYVLCIGDDGANGIFHDPYGQLDNLNGGYDKIGSGGMAVKYDWTNWLKRWLVEGPNSGWFMTFRKQ